MSTRFLVIAVLLPRPQEHVDRQLFLIVEACLGSDEQCLVAVFVGSVSPAERAVDRSDRPTRSGLVASATGGECGSTKLLVFGPNGALV